MSTYPALPGNRFAYDVDGTTVVYRNSDGTVTNLSQAQMQVLQNESPDGTDYIKFNSSGYISFAFPELRDVTGIFYATDETGTLGGGAEWSPDSGDGMGGTWNVITPTVVGTTATKPEYRSNLNVVSLTGVKAVRVKFPAYVSSNYDFAIRTVHIYGSYAEASDRLEFWHPTLDQRVDAAHFDYGDIRRNETVVKQFRIKNTSATLTANTISLTAGALTNSSPSHTAMHTFSSDGSSYVSSLDVGTLAPGAVSGILYDKFVTPIDAQSGPWAGRLQAVATSWT